MHFPSVKLCRSLFLIGILGALLTGPVCAVDWEQSYEAEVADTLSGGFILKTRNGFSCPGYVNMETNGSYVEWKHVNVPSDGVYHLAFVYANGNPGMNPCKVLVNGSDTLLDSWKDWKYLPRQAIYTFPWTGGWEVWRILKIGVRLKTGDNTIRLTTDTKTGPHLDKIIVTVPPPVTEPAPPSGSKGWARVPEILSRIVPPVFAGRDFIVTEFGGVGDSKTNCVLAFRKAIAECHAAGGGRVVVPAGTYLVNGPIHLLSKVNLHLKAGARINFRGSKSDYLPAVMTAVEGTLFYGYSPMIYAYQQEDIALTGEGPDCIIDGGQSIMLWKVTNKSDYREYAEVGMPIKERPRGGEPFHKEQNAKVGLPVKEPLLNETRPQCIEFFECRNVLMSDYQVVDSPFWVQHPIKCVNVTLRSVLVNSRNQNNDGFDPESCRDVLVDGCTFYAGDDDIAIKAGRGSDGWDFLGPCEDIIIRNCRFGAKGIGIAVGSEMSGGVRNVFVYDCGFEESGLFRMKTSHDRGGYMKDFYVKNVKGMKTVLYTSNNYSYRGYYYLTLTEGIFFEDCPDLEQLEIRGARDNHLRNFSFINCKNPKGTVDFLDGLVIRNAPADQTQ